MTLVNLDGVLPSATIMVVSVTGSTTNGQPLSARAPPPPSPAPALPLRHPLGRPLLPPLLPLLLPLPPLLLPPLLLHGQSTQYTKSKGIAMPWVRVLRLLMVA